MPKQILTQARLKEVLHYNPDTGDFMWKARLTNRVKIGDIAGTKDFGGYINIQIDNVLYKAHRLAFLYVDGMFPENKVDHNKGIRDCNKYAELQSVNNVDHCRNRAIPSTNTSGVIGVCFDKSRNKWQASIGVDGKQIHLGRYKNIEDAKSIRLLAERRYCFNENHGKRYVKYWSGHY